MRRRRRKNKNKRRRRKGRVEGEDKALPELRIHVVVEICSAATAWCPAPRAAAQHERGRHGALVNTWRARAIECHVYFIFQYSFSACSCS